jgi:type IV pilus assembly protein PilN
MNQIDINLLNDRPEYSTGSSAKQTAFSSEDKTPLILGGAVAGGLIGLVLLALGGLSVYNQQLASENARLESSLSKLAPELAKLEQLKLKESVILAETAALAKVFNQIKPWSATLQDLRDRVPPTLQITSIEQSITAVAPPPAGQPTPGASPSPAPEGQAPAAPAPPPSSDLKINGNALTFSDINDFELILRKSPFLKPESSKLVSSQREADAQSKASLIKYEIKTQQSDVPASELLQVLNAKGATGLVARIEVLKRQGVMKP